jgi:hypothetical protein
MSADLGLKKAWPLLQCIALCSPQHCLEWDNAACQDSKQPYAAAQCQVKQMHHHGHGMPRGPTHTYAVNATSNQQLGLATESSSINH